MTNMLCPLIYKSFFSLGLDNVEEYSKAFVYYNKINQFYYSSTSL